MGSKFPDMNLTFKKFRSDILRIKGRIMSKKLDGQLKKLTTQKKLHKDFTAGGVYVKELFDSALVEIFGKKFGAKASNYLLDSALKGKKKKKK